MKPKVGLLGLTLDLYKRHYPQLITQLEAFSNELCHKITGFADVSHEPAVWTRENVEKAIGRFERDDVDIIIVVLLSYSPSLISLPALLRTNKPLLIFNTQKLCSVTSDFGPEEMMTNHGMHGVQDLCNMLTRHDRPFHLVTGHYESEEALDDVRACVQAASAVSRLRGARIGMIGHTFDGMGDLYVDGSLLPAKMGVEICHVSYAALADRIAAVREEQAREVLACDRQQFSVDENVTEQDHQASVEVELGIRALIEELNLSAVCALFYAVTDHPGVRTPPFLAISKLLAEGYGYGGEGDPTSATAVLLMQKLTPESNFTEMFTTDFAGQAIFMNHMAETNYKVGRSDLPVRLILNDAAFLPGAPCVCVFTVQKPGLVTLLNLTTTSGGRLKMIGAIGEVEDWGPAPGVLSPHFKWRPHCQGGVGEFLTRYSLEGGSHHLALGYGDHRKALEAAANMMGIEWVEVTD